MEKIKISAVSYLNTIPFLYGIKSSKLLEQIELQLDYPSECARKLISQEVDMGLVPVAALLQIPDYQIISDYCIGANNAVRTVLLVSNVPVTEIEAIELDYQSRTSVALVKVLAKHFWQISPKFVAAQKDYEPNIGGKNGGVIIGDRTFLPYIQQYKYVYDLAEQWKLFCGLPFVFAVWASNKKMNQQFCESFNAALEIGINNLENVVNEYNEVSFIDKSDLYDYLKNNISYQLNSEKIEGMNLFLKFLKEGEFGVKSEK